jgi:hypothetical protein
MAGTPEVMLQAGRRVGGFLVERATPVEEIRAKAAPGCCTFTPATGRTSSP